MKLITENHFSIVLQYCEFYMIEIMVRETFKENLSWDDFIEIFFLEIEVITKVNTNLNRIKLIYTCIKFCNWCNVKNHSNCPKCDVLNIFYLFVV